MTIGPEHEQPQAGGDGTDAVTVTFGDPDTGLYGLARTGLVGEERSGMGLVFAGTEPLAVRSDGVEIEVVEPLQRWRATMQDVFDLELEALSTPAETALGGMDAYDQLVRVRGTVADRTIDCLGQRGHSWGRPDWSKLELARSVSAWLDDGYGVTLTAVRDRSAKHHADEKVSAHVVLAGVPVPVADPRLSTTYDAGGRQVHAGLELWVAQGEGEYPHRGAGEVVCGTTLDLGELRADVAFFAWRMEGRSGVGRYDIVRRADA